MKNGFLQFRYLPLRTIDRLRQLFSRDNSVSPRPPHAMLPHPHWHFQQRLSDYRLNRHSAIDLILYAEYEFIYEYGHAIISIWRNCHIMKFPFVKLYNKRSFNNGPHH